MKLWTPSNEWNGQDAFIIGGGSSLRDFDFSLLKGANTIGCNEAFRLGSEIVKICLFGDASWFQKSKWDLEKFKGTVVCIAPSLVTLNVDWIRVMKRENHGFYTGEVLGWNNSTGASAVNLAVTLGAKRIFLLGFDMKLDSQGKSHWHTRYAKPTASESFTRFLNGFKDLAGLLKTRASHVEVFQVTNEVPTLPFTPITFEGVRGILVQEVAA